MAIAWRSAGTGAGRSASNTTTLTVTQPAGHQADDLLLLIAASYNSVSPVDVTTPAGWTLIAGMSGTSFALGTSRAFAFYKVAASSSEPSVALTTASASFLDAQITAFSGVDATTPIDVNTAWAVTGVSSGTAAVQAITTVTNDALLVDAFVDWDQNPYSTPPAGASARSQAVIATFNFVLATETKITPGTEAADVYTKGSAGTHGAAGIVIALRETTRTYAWDFGDGGTSTVMNPSHTYASPGTYTVALTATNVTGPNTKTRTNYVTVSAPPFTPQIIWFTPAPLTGAPAAPTFESATAYSTVANRPAVTGTTRPFASSAALTGALNAAAPGDLVQYTGAGILDIPGNYQGFAGRRYTGYVNIDLGLPGSANHVRFPGGAAGFAAVDIFNAQYLRIYGGEITNSTGGGTCGLEINAASVPHDGSTNHITWWNLLVRNCRSDGIRVLPTLAFSGSSPTAADLTISDCDIEAEVYNVCLDKTIDVHAELGTGQHCCLLADTDPIGATYPSFLRNRVAIDGHDTGLTANQGGGSVIELGFNDAACTLSGCTLILRGNNTMFNAQQQTGGNGLNLWGDAPIGCTIPFLQHSNATGSAVLNYPEGVNRSSVVVQYGRHSRTNLNAFEGTRTWQIGVTYLNVD